MIWNVSQSIYPSIFTKFFSLGISENLGKVIHVMRNPKDVAVSYYHFSQINPLLGNFSGTWDTFFESFMIGNVVGGTWYDYMIDWLAHKTDSNILWIKYEDFLIKPQYLIRAIATFVGKHIDDATTEKIADVIAFNSMKNNPNLDVAANVFKGKFLRKGRVGDWENYFTKEQEARVNEMYQRFQVETGVELCFK